MSDHDWHDLRETATGAMNIVRGGIPSPVLASLIDEKVPTGFARPCRPKPATSALLHKELAETNGLYFQNIAEAASATAQALWRPLTNDASIPVSDEEDRAVVKTLVDAFKDMTIARDTPGNAYRKRLTKGEAVFYNEWSIEACAWNILGMLKSIHTKGFNAPIYDHGMVDSIGQTQLWTFQERLDWVTLVLKKHEKLWTAIGAPHKLYNSTLVNFASNANRNNWVKAGREADEAHTNRPKRQRTVRPFDTNMSTFSSTTTTKDRASTRAGRPRKATTKEQVTSKDKKETKEAKELDGMVSSQLSPVPSLCTLTCSFQAAPADANTAEHEPADIVSTSSATATTTSSTSTSAPLPQQITADVEMTDIDAALLAEKKLTEKNFEDSMVATERKVSEQEHIVTGTSFTSLQANVPTATAPQTHVTAHRAVDDVQLHDAQTMEAAYLLGLLHTAR
ncbi:hypothetical protein N0V83_009629 [Neocucurbitaria cava]|uniref:Uncharacterized protein n=1 Tax=Neocucurbitaria cava TaxID=798079 RepID=A0A9W9CII2_9PLEO|nr:hypothetical protein N0V83_009629 [Neocucurbitaria cava]